MSTGAQCLFCKTSFHCRLENVKTREWQEAQGACSSMAAGTEGKIAKRAAAQATADANPEALSSSSESHGPE
eukprot:1081402-Pelagomonas_calceolata.AAC.1